MKIPHDFEKVVKTWQEADFWSHRPLEHSVTKLVCKRCGMVAGPDSKEGRQKGCFPYTK